MPSYLSLLLLVSTAVCQNVQYEAETDSLKEERILFNLLGHVTLEDVIRSTVQNVLTEIEKDGFSNNSNKQCVRRDEIDALRSEIKSDQETVMKLLQRGSDQLEELQATVNSGISGENSSFYSVESSPPMTLTLVGQNIPPLSMLEDAAFGKHTYCSSVYEDYLNRYANDGDDASLYHSKRDIKPWWIVDLVRERTIYFITILPRQVSEWRFHDVEIRIGDTLKINGDFSSHRLLAIYKGHYALDQGTLKFTFYSGIKGRFLSIKITSEAREFLQLNTVQAIGLKN